MTFHHKARIKHNKNKENKRFCLARDYCGDCPNELFCKKITFVSSSISPILYPENYKQISNYLNLIKEYKKRLKWL